ncbi:glycosyltransferase family 2 protein [uncultured Desulfovibrio sp.]|uniref:glycosyltransferase family 2 protein n=1 Tax=uncultured Desulfovibrio sp. TaxID=167968 RepID=UPI00266EE59E|nr:glycosyltransferase family 2 protein [uncultured Desulfovibrio sp.]
MNVLILAAQNSRQDMQEEPTLPVCLTEIDGKPLLELLTEAVEPLKPERIIFAFMKHDIAHWGLDYIVEQLAPGSVLISVEKITAGAACTALLGAPYIDNDEELLILSANELVRQELGPVIEDFRARGADAGVMSFNSVHPRYAYVRLDANGNVVEASEKRPISRNAIPGIFWFLKGRQFVEAAKNILRKDAKVRNTFYISSTLNELILEHRSIGMFPIEKEFYIPLKTEKQLDQFELLKFMQQV